MGNVNSAIITNTPRTFTFCFIRCEEILRHSLQITGLRIKPEERREETRKRGMREGQKVRNHLNMALEIIHKDQ
jgi:hypothetical protein